MPIDEMIKIKKIGDRKTAQKLFLVLNCALVLRRKVVANIVAIKKTDLEDIKELLKETNIDVLVLYSRRDKVIVYLYRKEDLEKHLKNEDVRCFLNKYGYKNDNISDTLDTLVSRFYEYENNNQGFPHEIGVFFGYPLVDVESFIMHNGQGALLVGYWKVYHNLEESRKLFESFDEERIKAVKDIVNGKSIYDIAC